MNGFLWNSLMHGRLAALTVIVLGTLATTAHADSITVVNGSFEQTLTNTSSEFGSLYSSQQVTGWTTNGYNFVFLSGTADTTGAQSQYGSGLRLWGPNDGSANGLPASSPDGGNFLAMDGAYGVGAISQMIGGLTPGVATTVSFYYAGAQQYGYNGLNTEQLEVSLGNDVLYTPVLSNTSHGFTGWQMESMTFTPTSSMEVLSFMANGTPSGVPPMSLLDGVSVSTSPVPEPGSLALVMTGVAGLGGLVRARFSRDAVGSRGTL